MCEECDNHCQVLICLYLKNLPIWFNFCNVEEFNEPSNKIFAFIHGFKTVEIFKDNGFSPTIEHISETNILIVTTWNI